MLKRKIYDELLKWKKTKNKECLLVKGARQIGKTFIIDQLGKQEYTKYVCLNFYAKPGLKSIFTGTLEAQEIYKKIMMEFPDFEVIPGETLLFLDEIQECPNARTALKFLAMDNRCDVIASGSMLGINYKEIASIPVGYERQMDMYALDFEEFLWALGWQDKNIKLVHEQILQNREPLPRTVIDSYQQVLREYMAVGGMPEAVNCFLRTNNFSDVHNIQTKILDDYFADIKKYATIAERQKITDCYKSLVVQLAKDYTKFQYKNISSDGRAAKYANSLNWLEDAGLIRLCYNVSVPEFPLRAYVKLDQFKAYATDIGLLTAMFGLKVQLALVKNELKGTVKGGIYENLIFDVLNKRGIETCYFKNSENTQEIEFLLEGMGEVIPVEVKSRNGSTLSLNNFIGKYKPSVAYKLIDGNVGADGAKITLPHFAAMFLS